MAIQKQSEVNTVIFINHQLNKIRHQESIISIAIVTWPQESCLGVRLLLDFVPSPSSPPVVPCGIWLHSYPREIITFQPTDNKRLTIVSFVPIVMSSSSSESIIIIVKVKVLIEASYCLIIIIRLQSESVNRNLPYQTRQKPLWTRHLSTGLCQRSPPLHLP